MISSNDFVDISIDWSDRADDFNKIWNYIDAGFIVYFVKGNDHIETGFPRNPLNTLSAFKKVIGGGKYTKIKGVNSRFMKNEVKIEDKWEIGRGIKAFIYLGILNKNN